MGPSLKLKQLFIGMKGELNPQSIIPALGPSSEAPSVWGKCVLTQQAQSSGELHRAAT